MPERAEQKTIEGWKRIAKFWNVTERTARRWAARMPGLVRKHRLTGRVFGYEAKLADFKAEHAAGEPLGCVEPGSRVA